MPYTEVLYNHMHVDGRNAGVLRGWFIPAETLVQNGTADDNVTAGGTLNQPVLGFWYGYMIKPPPVGNVWGCRPADPALLHYITSLEPHDERSIKTNQVLHVNSQNNYFPRLPSLEYAS